MHSAAARIAVGEDETPPIEMDETSFLSSQSRATSRELFGGGTNGMVTAFEEPDPGSKVLIAR